MEIRSSSATPDTNPPRSDITRVNRETIERVTPDPSAEQVRERIDRNRDAVQERAEQARSSHVAARIQNARALHAASDGAGPERVSAQERAAAVREAQLAERAQNARALQQAERVANARDGIDLSETSLRLRAAALRGQDEPEVSRAERVAHLRELYGQGRLDSNELIARAAENLLGGE